MGERSGRLKKGTVISRQEAPPRASRRTRAAQMKDARQVCEAELIGQMRVNVLNDLSF
jgi:hypothetical protein